MPHASQKRKRTLNEYKSSTVSKIVSQFHLQTWFLFDFLPQYKYIPEGAMDSALG